MDPLREAFETVLKKERYDRLTRLAYADYLAERGEDEAANEQRRMATPEWEKADRWMHEKAAECGETIENYGEAVGTFYASERTDRDREEYEASLKYRPITYDDLVQAGYDYVKDEDCFVQRGSQTCQRVMNENPDMYWKHWSIITGEPEPRPGKYGRSAPFSCSC